MKKTIKFFSRHEPTAANIAAIKHVVDNLLQPECFEHSEEWEADGLTRGHTSFPFEVEKCPETDTFHIQEMILDIPGDVPEIIIAGHFDQQIVGELVSLAGTGRLGANQISIINFDADNVAVWTAAENKPVKFWFIENGGAS